ncbi:MAG: hypothetical protein JSS10_01245 [Verrucomicrobia bacterium]|nr:hypothetical protein [Verrucomicrobiota bacterium]
MATGFLQDVTKGLNTVLAGNWHWVDLGNGLRSGFGTIHTWQKLSELNTEIHDRKMGQQNFFSFLSSLVQSSWKITRTAIKAHRVAPALPLLAQHTTAIKCTAAAWMGMNALAFIAHGLGQGPAIGETFFGSIWERTPSALLATQIALTALELRTNFTKAAISFVSMGITYFDGKRSKYLPSGSGFARLLQEL